MCPSDIGPRTHGLRDLLAAEGGIRDRRMLDKTFRDGDNPTARVLLSLADGLTLDRVTVRDNLATSSSAPATGGGISTSRGLGCPDSRSGLCVDHQPIVSFVPRCGIGSPP